MIFVLLCCLGLVLHCSGASRISSSCGVGKTPVVDACSHSISLHYQAQHLSNTVFVQRTRPACTYKPALSLLSLCCESRFLLVDLPCQTGRCADCSVLSCATVLGETDRELGSWSIVRHAGPKFFCTSFCFHTITVTCVHYYAAQTSIDFHIVF